MEIVFSYFHFLILNTNFNMKDQSSNFTNMKKIDLAASKKFYEGLCNPQLEVDAPPLEAALHSLSLEKKTLSELFSKPMNYGGLNGSALDDNPNYMTTKEFNTAMKNAGQNWLNEGLEVTDQIIEGIANSEAVKEFSGVIKETTGLIGDIAKKKNPFEHSFDNTAATASSLSKENLDRLKGFDKSNAAVSGVIATGNAALDEWDSIVSKVEEAVGLEKSTGNPYLKELPPRREIVGFEFPKNSSEVYDSDLLKIINSTDFTKNTFDVFFEFKGPDKSKLPSIYKLSKALDDRYNNLEKKFISSESPLILSSRITKIGLPGISQGTNNIKFCGSNIDICNNMYEDPHQASFSIRADQGLYWIDTFNKLAGSDSYSNNNLKEKTKIIDLDTSTTKVLDSLGELPFVSKNNVSEKSLQNTFFNIYIRWLPSTPKENKKLDNNPELQKETGSSFYSNNFIMFEDVKILGANDGISFKRDSPSIQEFTYEFIYRKAFTARYLGRGDDWEALLFQVGSVDKIDELLANLKK